MPILMRGKRVGVERLGKAKKDNLSMLAMPEDASAVGLIRYVGKDASPDLQVGQKVYYGKNHHQIKIQGADILVMDEEEIYAVVEESQNDETPTSSSA